jgi:hypothetical protein
MSGCGYAFGVGPRDATASGGPQAESAFATVAEDPPIPGGGLP